MHENGKKVPTPITQKPSSEGGQVQSIPPEASNSTYEPPVGQQNARYKKALRFLSDYSGRISSAGYTLGNGLMLAKAGIYPDMDTLAGLFFFGTSTSMAFTDKYPTEACRAAGGFGLAATATICAKEIMNSNGSFAGTTARVASQLFGFGVPSALMMGQKEVAQAAEKAKTSKNIAKRALAHTQRFPLVTAAAIDSIGLGGFGVSAYQDGDWKRLAVTGLWTVGAVGLGLADPGVRQHLRNYSSNAPESVKPEHQASGQNKNLEQSGTIFDNKQ